MFDSGIQPSRERTPTRPIALPTSQPSYSDSTACLKLAEWHGAFLWPPPGAQTLSPNDTSQVLKLTCGGRSILFTGDVQQPALESLLRNPAALAADVLIAPHHGSAEPVTAAFLTAAASPTILASSDRTPTRKQRDFDALAAAQNRTLLRTNQCGAITVRVGKDGAIKIETYLRR